MYLKVLQVVVYMNVIDYIYAVKPDHGNVYNMRLKRAVGRILLLTTKTETYARKQFGLAFRSGRSTLEIHFFDSKG